MADIKKQLTEMGVPAYVHRTTLLKEGREDLREWIKTESYENEAEVRRVGVSMYPGAKCKVSYLRTVFYLLAKELCLSGLNVRCASLSDLALMEEAGELHLLYGLEFLFITDFYEEGAAMPLLPEMAMHIRTLIRTVIENGNAVCTLSDVDLKSCDWWPPNILSLLEERNEVLRINQA